MTELVSYGEKLGELERELTGDHMQRQLALACASAISPERMARIALTELRRTPKLLQCSKESFFGALMECAQLGLEPGPTLGLAYLIPYGKECQFQLGYRGAVNLLWRSQQVCSVQSEVVHERDHFSYSQGTSQHLDHVPAGGDRGEPTHAYCCIGVETGGKTPGWIVRVMSFDEIEDIRTKYSKDTRRDSAWVTGWSEMACKTVIKRTGKRAPVSSQLQRAISLDDMAEARLPQGLAANLDLNLGAEPEPPARDVSPAAQGPAAVESEDVEIDPDTGEVIPAGVGDQYQQQELASQGG